MAGEEADRRAKAIRKITATIFLRASGKTFGFFKLSSLDRVVGRQNIDIKGLAGKILRGKDLQG